MSAEEDSALPPAGGDSRFSALDLKAKAAALSPKSYRDLNPLEQGGRTARDGFDYQDHIAVNKCLDMLLSRGPVEVWCETEDDIVLVSHVGTLERFEFVQVKGEDLGQGWSVSKLCEEEPGGGGASKTIAGRSLGHDRGLEPCRFRLVTRWPPMLDLKPLSVEPDPDGTRSWPDLHETATKFQEKLSPLTSGNGHDFLFWLQNLVWEVRAQTSDVKKDSLVKLHELIHLEGEALAPDQCEELHDNLYRRVQDASLADGVHEKQKKRLRRDELRQWLSDRIRSIRYPTHSGGTRPLEEKFRDAQIADPAALMSAIELRRRYLAETRSPKYLSLDTRDEVELEALERLHTLKARLNCGELPDDGPQFLARCLAEMDALRSAPPGERVPAGILKGYLYDIMNRCLHRLIRSTL